MTQRQEQEAYLRSQGWDPSDPDFDWSDSDVMRLLDQYSRSKGKAKAKEQYPTPEGFVPGPSGSTGGGGSAGGASSEGAANWMQYYLGEYPTPTTGKYAETTQYKMPPFYQLTEPQFMGTSWLSEILKNPYAIPDDMLQDTLQAGEKAYARAKGQIGAGLKASGAEEGGVAKGTLGQVDLAHAGQTADSIRNWNQFMLKMGDDRLKQMWLPYMNLWNQAFAIAEGQPPPDQSSMGEDILSAVATAAPYFMLAA